MKTPERDAVSLQRKRTVSLRSKAAMAGSASVAWLSLLVSLGVVGWLVWGTANSPLKLPPIMAPVGQQAAEQAVPEEPNAPQVGADQTRAELSARVTVLEDLLPDVRQTLEQERGLLAQANAEREQLRRLYEQTIQDSVALAALDIEPLLDQAQSLLADGSPIQAPISVLAAARERAARAASPQLEALIEALDKDRQALQVVAQRSVRKAADDLHRLALGLDALPLQSQAVATAAPTIKDSPEASAVEEGGKRLDPNDREAGWLDRLVKSSSELIELPAAVGDGVVRVTDVGASDLGVLPPSAAYFLLENLRLRLLSARLSLLMHDRQGFDADRQRALSWLQDHFVQTDENTKRAVSLLISLEALGRPAVDLSLANSRRALEALSQVKARQ